MREIARRVHLDDSTVAAAIRGRGKKAASEPGAPRYLRSFLSFVDNIAEDCDSNEFGCDYANATCTNIDDARDWNHAAERLTHWSLFFAAAAAYCRGNPEDE